MRALRRTGLLLATSIALSTELASATEFVDRARMYRFRYPDDWKVVYGGDGRFGTVGIGTSKTHPGVQRWNGPLIGVFPAAAGQDLESLETTSRGQGIAMQRWQSASGVPGGEWVDENGDRTIHLYPTSRGRRFSVFLQHESGDPETARYESALERVLQSIESDAGWEAAERRRTALRLKEDLESRLLSTAEPRTRAECRPPKGRGAARPPVRRRRAHGLRSGESRFQALGLGVGQTEPRAWL